MPQIVVVEDNDNMAFGLQRMLEAEGHEVLLAPDGERGIEVVRSTTPDLVILDVMLPTIDGFAVLRAIRGMGMTVPVLMLTARSEETDKVHGLRVGADDYVTKPFGLSELLARVQALLRRSHIAHGAAERRVVRFGAVAVDPDAGTVTRGGDEVHLTPKAFDLLMALAGRPGSVISRGELLRRVWGHTADTYTRTVDMHVAELRRKLEDDPAAPRHIVTVWKRGYRFDP